MSEERCPVCGCTEWYIDYDLCSDGDEMRVDRCEQCDWPPPYPSTVKEWRAKWQARTILFAAEVERLREARRVLAVAHKFAGGVLLWANDPRRVTVHDFSAVFDEAERVKGELAVALAALAEGEETLNTEGPQE